jgi:hypothetical protein
LPISRAKRIRQKFDLSAKRSGNRPGKSAPGPYPARFPAGDGWFGAAYKRCLELGRGRRPPAPPEDAPRNAMDGLIAIIALFLFFAVLNLLEKGRID